MRQGNDRGDHEERVVLVVGSCGLDRLLMLPSYPAPDSKVRTTSYHEVGGGNAANTACAMSLMLHSNLFRSTSRIRVRLCTKLGRDRVGQKIVQDLQDAGVGVSSPLFRFGSEDSTTGFTTIIVSAQEQTRTCIHTPGTCGELTLADLQSIDMDQIFENVVHLHSDARHTSVALVLAREARKRGIPVSLDVEKDRGTKALDALLQESTIIFTNSYQVDEYLNRLTFEMETSLKRNHLPPPIIRRSSSSGEGLEELMSLYADAIRPSAYFTRWFRQDSKEVVITKGASGAFHIRCDGAAASDATDQVDSVENEIVVSVDSNSTRVKISQTFLDRCETDGNVERRSADYVLQQVGVVKPREVVDTTGAGDAFVAGFLLARVANFPSDFGMKLGSWVSGRKVEGPGARTALPDAHQVDETLGSNWVEADEALSRLVGEFGR